MIKSAYFPNKTFTNKQELFAELKTKKAELIGLKKASIIKSDGLKADASKLDGLVLSSDGMASKMINLDDAFSYHVINTTKYMDSHSDVHLDGIWNKSISDKQGKIYFVADHDLSIKSVIAYPGDVTMYTQDLPFRMLGKDFDGTTQALIFKVAKNKIVLEAAKNIIENKINIEHSIRMQYVNIELAIDESAEGYEQEKALFDATVGQIANKAQAVEQGYFWVVTEAKISQEGSMVLRGSNDATPILENKTEIIETVEPVKEIKEELKSLNLNRFIF